MKQALFILICLLAATAMAQDTVKLAWDQPTTGPQPDGYGVWDHHFQKPYGFDDEAQAACVVEDPAAIMCQTTAQHDRLTAYQAKSFIWGPYDLQGIRTKTWSTGTSNEVIYTPSTPEPEPPGNLLTQLVVAILNFFEPSWDGSSDPAVIHLGEMAAIGPEQ